MLNMRRSFGSCLLAGAALLATHNISAALRSAAFSAPPAADLRPSAAAGSAAPRAARSLRGDNSQATSSSLAGCACVGIVGVVAAAALGQTRRLKAVSCNAFSSSSSSFLGGGGGAAWTGVQETSPVVAEPSADYSNRQGVASMGMKNQAWFVKNTGWDGRSEGQIFDWKARESRRRGEELFLHDVDNFELKLNNLKRAPGSKKKHIRRGRGKYGSHGRTCGYGKSSGSHLRGKGTLNPYYESGNKPIFRRIPKLTEEHKAMVRPEPYTIIPIKYLNMCNEGDDVDYQDLVVKGIPVPRRNKWYPNHFKVAATETSKFDVKNLTVYAHAFEPPAREKIEALGGRCVRLSEETNLPIDQIVPVMMAADAD